MTSINLRTLTRKSKLGYGKHKDLTVQRVIDLNKKQDLISAYFKLSRISFNDDVLNELGITSEYRIDKPSANKELYYTFLNDKGYKRKLRTRDGANALKKETRQLSKAQLQQLNQGK